jgi:hypothetical protein
VTIAGRFLCVFFSATGALGVVAGVFEIVAGAGVDVCAGFETPTSAGFDACFEHALIASNRPRSTKLAIIAIFC